MNKTNYQRYYLYINFHKFTNIDLTQLGICKNHKRGRIVNSTFVQYKASGASPLTATPSVLYITSQNALPNSFQIDDQTQYTQTGISNPTDLQKLLKANRYQEESKIIGMMQTISKSQSPRYNTSTKDYESVYLNSQKQQWFDIGGQNLQLSLQFVPDYITNNAIQDENKIDFNERLNIVDEDIETTNFYAINSGCRLCIEIEEL